MKIFTILGCRPEIIRLSEIIKKIDKCIGEENHFIFNTMQNYNDNLNADFFEEFGLRETDYNCYGESQSFSKQLAAIFPQLETELIKFKPDKFLCLGDTNSSLGAIVAKRLGIPVYHMEAGNRCHSFKSPEEVNRHIIDHITDIHMPYTQRSKENLIAEGIRNHKIFVIGNPIYEILQQYDSNIQRSNILKTLNVVPGQYILVTLHRAENVDTLYLIEFLNALRTLSDRHKIIFSCHPHTRKNITPDFLVSINEKDFKILDPLGFIDFVCLEANALCVMSDSGTVQEECAILDVPNVVLRDYTERPETQEHGNCIISGHEVKNVVMAFDAVIKAKSSGCPVEYKTDKVSDNVLRILLSV